VSEVVLHLGIRREVTAAINAPMAAPAQLADLLE
jgi:hypothetical protein